MLDKVNLAKRLAMFTEHWSPKIVGREECRAAHGGRFHTLLPVRDSRH